MALVRWDSSRELSSLQAEMNRLFQSFFDTPSTGSTPGGTGGLRRWHPAMDLVETEDHFVLRADLPGVAESDVKVELEDNVLTLSGERRHEQEVKKGGYYRIERASGTFARTLTLPEGVDADAVEASVRQGRPRGPHPQARAAQAASRRHHGRRRPRDHRGRGSRAGREELVPRSRDARRRRQRGRLAIAHAARASSPGSGVRRPRRSSRARRSGRTSSARRPSRRDRAARRPPPAPPGAAGRLTVIEAGVDRHVDEGLRRLRRDDLR